MADPYPIPFEPLSWLGSSLDEMHAAAAGDPGQKVWAVIQAFGWNYGSAEVEKTGLGREPTAEELRALTYLALAHRAQGLFYYVYKSGKYFIKEKAGLWQEVKRTIGELKQFKSLVLAPEAKLDFKIECDRSDGSGLPAVHAILKDDHGFYLIAVNALSEPVQAVLDFKHPPSAAGFDVFSYRGYLLSGSRLSLEFGPLERKILYFNPAL